MVLGAELMTCLTYRASSAHQVGTGRCRVFYSLTAKIQRRTLFRRLSRFEANGPAPLHSLGSGRQNRQIYSTTLYRQFRQGAGQVSHDRIPRQNLPHACPDHIDATRYYKEEKTYRSFFRRRPMFMGRRVNLLFRFR